MTSRGTAKQLEVLFTSNLCNSHSYPQSVPRGSVFEILQAAGRPFSVIPQPTMLTPHPDTSIFLPVAVVVLTFSPLFKHCRWKVWSVSGSGDCSRKEVTYTVSIARHHALSGEGGEQASSSERDAAHACDGEDGLRCVDLVTTLLDAR